MDYIVGYVRFFSPLTAIRKKAEGHRAIDAW
jgi:hypothetical protein